MSCSDEPGRLSLTRRSWLQLMSAGVVAWPSHASAAEDDLRTLLPEDQSARDKSLQALLGTIRTIVRRRDSTALGALMAPDFKVEFDVGKGSEVFRREWKSEMSSSAVWTVLDRLLVLGGTFYSDSLFALPYVYTRFPYDLDRLRYVVAIGDIPAHAQSTPASPRVGRLTHAIVPLATPATPPAMLCQQPFVAVQHPAFGLCYVAGTDIYSPVGHRAFFEKRHGRWRWISLAAPTLATPPVLLATAGATP
jgi:hypothetical protein